MFIPDPGSWLLSLLDPVSNNSTATKEGGGGEFVVHSLKFYKIVNFFFACKEQNLSQFTKNYTVVVFTQKIVIKLSKYGFWSRDPGSGKNLFRIPDPGVKKASCIPDPDSQHCNFVQGPLTYNFRLKIKVLFSRIGGYWYREHVRTWGNFYLIF